MDGKTGSRVMRPTRTFHGIQNMGRTKGRKELVVGFSCYPPNAPQKEKKSCYPPTPTHQIDPRSFFPSRHPNGPHRTFPSRTTPPSHSPESKTLPTRATMPRLAAAAVARQAGAALRRGALGGLRPLSSLQPSHAASSEEVTERRADLPLLVASSSGIGGAILCR